VTQSTISQKDEGCLKASIESLIVVSAFRGPGRGWNERPSLNGCDMDSRQSVSSWRTVDRPAAWWKLNRSPVGPRRPSPGTAVGGSICVDLMPSYPRSAWRSNLIVTN